MKSSRKSFCCALAFVIGFLTAIAAPAGAYNVMAIGDSITAAAGYSGSGQSNGGYIPYLANRLGSGYQFVGTQATTGDPVYYHEGYPGATWQYFSAETNGVPFIVDLAKNNPDIILMHIGTNNISSYLQYPTNYLETYPADTANGIFESLLLQMNPYFNKVNNPVDIYLAQIIPIGGDYLNAVKAFNTALSLSVESHKYDYTFSNMNFHLVNMYDISWTADDFVDALHPSSSGYGEMATAWGDAMGVPPSPVPIPAPIFLLGGGLVGLAAIRRRFKHPSGPRIG